MHPRDEERFGGPSSGNLSSLVQKLVGVASEIVAPYHKWYKLSTTSNTDACGVDDPICALVTDYACRVMKKGGIEKDDARAFEIALTGILEAPIKQCNLCSNVRLELALDEDAKSLSGSVVIPCKYHGKLDWEFEIGEGVGEASGQQADE